MTCDSDGPRVAAMVESIRAHGADIEAGTFGRVELNYDAARVAITINQPRRLGEVQVDRRRRTR